MRFLKLADEKQLMVFNFIREESYKYGATKTFFGGIWH